MVVFITELLVQAFIICSSRCSIRQGWPMNGWKAVTRRGEWGTRLQEHIVPCTVCRVWWRCFPLLWHLVPFRSSRTVLEVGLYLESDWLVWLCAFTRSALLSVPVGQMRGWACLVPGRTRSPSGWMQAACAQALWSSGFSVNTKVKLGWDLNFHLSDKC